MQMSKNLLYENLFFVERTIKNIQAYKVNLRIIETAKNYRNVVSWERGDTCNLWSGYKEKEIKPITYIYLNESGATVPMKLSIK